MTTLLAPGVRAQSNEISFVQLNSATPQTPQTTVRVTYSGLEAAGDLNVVVVGWNDSHARITSVTDTAGNSYALAAGPIVQNGVGTQATYYAKNIAASEAGGNTVIVDFNTSARYPDVRIAEYSGIDPTNPLDASAGAQGNSATSDSGFAVTTNTNDLIVGANLVQSVTTGPGSGYTSRGITPYGDILEDKVVTMAGSIDATAVLDKNQAWIMQLVAFRAAGSGAAPAPSISSLNPTSGAVGTSITISGANFGQTQGTSTVKFNGTLGLPTSWNNTAIVVPVPAGATSGNVVVSSSGLASNGVDFTVTSPVTQGIQLVQHASVDAGVTTSSSLAFNGANTAGNWIAVVVRVGQSNNPITVLDTNGNTYRQAIQSNMTVDAETLGIFYAGNIRGGSNAVTVSDSISGTMRFAILEYSGVAASSSLEGTSFAEGTNAFPNSGNVTTTSGGDLLLGEISSSDPANFSAGNGYAIEEKVPAEPNTKLIAEDQVQSSAGTASASAVLGAQDPWGAVVAAFKAGTGGGSTAPNISSLSPNSGPVGTSVTITGSRFGTTAGTVTFNGTAASPTSWSDTQIVTEVPTGATTGNVVVTASGAASNGVPFTVSSSAPPTVSITAPASGTTVSGTISVMASASSSIGIAGVQFRVDGSNVGSPVTAAPYGISLDTTTLTNATHTLTAVATDTANNMATSAGVTITVNNSGTQPPPTVSITSPASGSTVSGTITVTASASSSVGIASVQFRIDGTNVGSPDTTSPYSYSLNTTTLSNASHMLTAVATDQANNTTTSAGVTITVNNSSSAPPPTVSITSPAPGATVSGTITVSASASSSIGIARVQFQVDGSNVGSPVTAAPYNISLDTTTLSNASHALTAIATDTAGASTASSGVIVTVSNATNTSMGPLVQSSTNSRYFVIQGTNQVVMLAGSHTWNDFLDIGTNGTPEAFDFNGFVSFLKAHGQNATILWRKDLPVECGWQGSNWVETPWPWLRPGPGTASDGQPKWDLTQFNQAFFDRLRQRVIQLQQAGIYAIVELFDGNNVASARCGNSSPNGDGYPFTGVNNINGIDDGYRSGSTGVGSFTMTTNNAVTNAQDAFVKKTIDTLNDLPNVLWELAEEQPGNGSFFTGSSGYGGASSMQFWAPHMAGLIKTYEKGGTWEGVTYPGKPLQHPVGIGAMSSQDPDDQALYSSPMDWISPTISSNWSDQFPSNVAINNQGKVVINDSDHALDAATILNSDGSVNTSHTRPYIWENLTSGAAGVLFMDPYVISLPNTSPVRNTCSTPVNGICTGGLDTKYEPFRSSFGYLPAVAAKLDMVKATPQPNLSNTGFCLADAVASGAEYLVYAPNGGTFTVNLSATTHNLSVLWIDPTSGAQTSAGTVIGGSSSQSFTPPWGSSRDAVLYLVDVAGHN